MRSWQYQKVFSATMLGISLVTLLAGQVSAVSTEQLNVWNNKQIRFYDTDPAGCVNSAAVTVGAGTLPSIIPEPYNGAFTAAGKAYNVSPLLVAAIFTEEHFTGQDTASLAGSWSNLPKVQPDPNKGWATSPDQAMGPFQFIPSTWASLGVDADKNGVKDVENLLDASFGAANYMATDGATADKPESVWHDFADGYSGHTGGYADKVIQYVDFYKAGGSATSASSTTAPTTTSASSSATCSTGSGAVQGNIVATAVNFAWDDFPSGHNASSYGQAQAKPAYVDAVAKYEAAAGSNQSSINSYTTDYTDCGAFVATVMRASGVDPNYEPLTTGNQLTYVQQNKDKYKVYAPGEWSTDGAVKPQPGDIFISDGHTYIYVGKQANTNYTVAEASQRGHVPEIDAQPYTQQTVGQTEFFYLVRFIGTGSTTTTGSTATNQAQL